MNTSVPESISSRNIFERKLAGIAVPKTADAIFVLRNWSRWITDNRVEWALNELMKGAARDLVLAYTENTKQEAEHVMWLANRLDWKSIFVVTDEWHMTRAMLTFIRARNHAGTSLAMYPLARPNDGYYDAESDEIHRIETYRAKGDVASYDEGVDYLCSLKQPSNLS